MRSPALQSLHRRGEERRGEERREEGSELLRFPPFSDYREINFSGFQGHSRNTYTKIHNHISIFRGTEKNFEGERSPIIGTRKKMQNPAITPRGIHERKPCEKFHQDQNF